MGELRPHRDWKESDQIEPFYGEKEVFEREGYLIRRRRKVVADAMGIRGATPYDDKAPVDKDPVDKDPVDKDPVNEDPVNEDPAAETKVENLVGVALSGGGMRSASFSIGFLETLGRSGLMRYVDYLSTVSGGGYAGAIVSTNAHVRGKDRDQKNGVWLRKVLSPFEDNAELPPATIRTLTRPLKTRIKRRGKHR